MIHPTTTKHDGQPVLEISGLPLSNRLTPAFVGGVQVGFLREQCTTLPRERVELERLRYGFREVGGVRWVGD